MSNDKSISQLISLSLNRQLGKEESAELEKHLNESNESRKFAELSQLIEKSVAAKQGSELSEVDEPDAGLSRESRQRLKSSVLAAIEEKKRQSQQGLPGKGNSARSAKPTSTPIAATAEKRELISRFRLIRQTGQDSLGNIWLARDEKLDRTITIRELDAEALESSHAWERFHREAAITGNLQHPNIISLYQFGVDRKSGEPFCAMQWVGERTLADAIDEYHDGRSESEKLGLFRLLNVFLDVCQAVSYAHVRGVINQNLHPRNVALERFGKPILKDWSLARVVEGSEIGGKLANAPAADASDYMKELPLEDGDRILFLAPEQALQKWDEIDERTDVYGLGAILFSILTSHAPHEEIIANLSDSESVFQEIAQSQPPLASHYDQSLPGDLVSICSKSLARDPQLRFDSVQELADEIESWLAGESRE